MSIKQKTITLFIFLVAVFLTALSSNLIAYQRLCRQQAEYQKSAAVAATVEQLRRAETMFMARASDDTARTVEHCIQQLPRVGALSQLCAAYAEEFSRVRERVGPRGLAINFIELERCGRELELGTVKLRQENEQRILASQAAGMRLQIGIIAICLSAVGIALGMALHMIFWPLKLLQRLFKRVPQDGLLCERHIPISEAHLRGINFKDEVGALARAYLDMAARWNNTCLGLQDKMKETESLYKVKSEFTSVVSHELRTPLTAIKEGIDYVYDGTAGSINEEQREFLEIAKRNVDRLARLINNVLDFTKLSAPQVPFRNEQVVLNEIVQSVINFYRLVMEKKGLKVKTDLTATEGLQIMLDPDRLNQVLSNLLNNAIKFTDRGTVETFTVLDPKSNFVEVCVADSGQGMRSEDIPLLFKPFTQLGEQRSRKPGGTGLGLAICKQIIERMGGKIWAESVLAKGSIFHFILPLQERRKGGKKP